MPQRRRPDRRAGAHDRHSGQCAGGIPAGIVRLDYATFSVYTLIGSAVWCAVLCALGVQVGADVGKGEMHRVTIVLVAFLAVVGALYYAFVHRHMREASKAR